MEESVVRDFGSSPMVGDAPMLASDPGEVQVNIKARDRRNPFACSEGAAPRETFTKVRRFDPVAQRRRLDGAVAGALPA